MKQNFNAKLCIYCNGQPELRTQRAGHALTRGGADMGKKFFVRCKKCHARTEAFISEEKAIMSWNVGNIFKINQNTVKN